MQDNGHSSHRDYMHSKKLKLQKQYIQLDDILSQETNDINSSLSLFKGFVFHVNGYTSISLIELKKLIINNGGEYESYPNSRVTHFIADTLPPSTIQRFKNNEKIVKCKWIIDSVNSGILLPWINYRLLNTNEINESNSIPITSLFEKDNNISKVPTNAPKTCTDENFLNSYYKKSRLHHLSEWKNLFKEELDKELQLSLDLSQSNDNVFNNIYFHVDMDCFFASVATRYHPDLYGLPVGISHSKNPAGSADIAACNYEARKYGVRNGMWLKTAFKLCPELQIVGYEFDKYEKISKIFFKLLQRYSKKIEILSCDEAFMGISTANDALAIASSLRLDILNHTGCTASIGIGANRLLARIATKFAKPDGIFRISKDNMESILASLYVRELPRVGRKFNAKLQSHNIDTVGDLLTYSLSWLQNEFGPKSGELLYNFARGIDLRNHNNDKKRKSIGVDCNWGIRLSTVEETFSFLLQLTNEFCTRLSTASVTCGTGATDNISKSSIVSPNSSSPSIIHNIIMYAFKELIKQHKFAIEDIRGFSIHGQKLQEHYTDNRTIGKKRKTNTISQSFKRIPNPPEPKRRKIINLPIKEKPKKMKSKNFIPQSESQIDSNVFNELPKDIQSEVLNNIKPKNNNKNNNENENSYIVSATELEDGNKEIEYYKKFSNKGLLYAKFIKIVDNLTISPTPQQWKGLHSIIMNMINSFNLEDTQKSMRLILSKSKHWNIGEVSIFIDSIQQIIIEKYGGPLSFK